MYTFPSNTLPQIINEHVLTFGPMHICNEGKRTCDNYARQLRHEIPLPWFKKIVYQYKKTCFPPFHIWQCLIQRLLSFLLLTDWGKVGAPTQLYRPCDSRFDVFLQNSVTVPGVFHQLPRYLFVRDTAVRSRPCWKTGLPGKCTLPFLKDIVHKYQHKYKTGDQIHIALFSYTFIRLDIRFTRLKVHGYSGRCGGAYVAIPDRSGSRFINNMCMCVRHSKMFAQEEPCQGG